jgi:hypothetical protein
LAIAVAVAWFVAESRAQRSRTNASYSSISARSMRRSAVRPNGSNGVPRKNFSLAKRPNTPYIHGPKDRLVGLPRSKIGGAKWK